MTISYQLGFRQIRIDTHLSNKRMQHVITKAGFDYRGGSYIDHQPDEARNAYQILLP